MIISEIKGDQVYSTEIKPSRWRLVSGTIMLFFAAYIWFHPLATMVGLALYLGLAFIVMGVGYLAVSTKATIGRDMFVGMLDILVGIILVSNLGITAATMPIILAFCLDLRRSGGDFRVLTVIGDGGEWQSLHLVPCRYLCGRLGGRFFLLLQSQADDRDNVRRQNRDRFRRYS